MRTPEGLRSLQETSQNPTTELATSSGEPPSSRGPGTPARTSTLLALFPITIIASVLEVIEFYAGPNPFDGDSTFGYTGTGVAGVMSVEVYDLAGAMVWAAELTDVKEIVWDGTTGARCHPVANGAYIYVITATDGTNVFTDKGKLCVNR